MGQQRRTDRGAGEEHEDNLEHDAHHPTNQLTGVVARSGSLVQSLRAKKSAEIAG
jgi:hypothetical protein